jgi:trimeric autotransporter adhesin
VRTLLLLSLAACSFDHGHVPGDATGSGSDGNGSDGGSGSDGGGSGSDAPGSPLRQKTITITGAVTGTLTDFPLWISLTDSDLAARARVDGTDIYFVSGTAKLDYQIQSWTKSTGRLDAWVRVPSLATNTTLAIRYGDVTAAHAPNPPSTFAGYAAVWHLDDPLTNATVSDTRNLTNGTASMLNTGDSTAARLGKGFNFGGGNDQVAFTNPITGGGAHTISMWISQRATANNDAIIALGNGTANQARWFHSRYEAATLAVGFYGNDYPDPEEDIIGDGWTLLHWVYDGNRMTRIYRDGALVAGPFQHDNGINTQGQSGLLGNAGAPFGTNMGLNATLDEVRIITVVRSAAWIAAEFANQMAGSTFYSLSPEQTP